MNITEKRLGEINARKAEIRSLLDSTETADLDTLEKELRDLDAEKTTLERRQAIAAGIDSGAITPNPIPNPVNGPIEEQRGYVEPPEYRSAWLKNIRNLDVTEAEKRALTTAAASVGSAIPTVTANKIIEKVKEYSPLLDEIELLHIPDKVTVPAEGTTNDAAKHTEGAAITASADTLSYVALSQFEITKLITISKSVEKMSIDAFESWLVKKLARKIGEKCETYVLNGSGSNEPEGINAITWDATNSVTVAANASLTEANIQTVVGLFNKGYSAGAKWKMASTTFFSDFHPLMNNSKNNTVTFDGKEYRVMGYPVSFDERQAAHEAILGNFARGYLGNLSEEITVTSAFVLRENSYDFLGTAMFDGKVQAVEAFVKIKKAS